MPIFTSFVTTLLLVIKVQAATIGFTLDAKKSGHQCKTIKDFMADFDLIRTIPKIEVEQPIFVLIDYTDDCDFLQAVSQAATSKFPYDNLHIRLRGTIPISADGMPDFEASDRMVKHIGRYTAEDLSRTHAPCVWLSGLTFVVTDPMGVKHKTDILSDKLIGYWTAANGNPRACNFNVALQASATAWQKPEYAIPRKNPLDWMVEYKYEDFATTGPTIAAASIAQDVKKLSNLYEYKDNGYGYPAYRNIIIVTGWPSSATDKGPTAAAMDQIALWKQLNCPGQPLADYMLYWRSAKDEPGSAKSFGLIAADGKAKFDPQKTCKTSYA